MDDCLAPILKGNEEKEKTMLPNARKEKEKVVCLSSNSILKGNEKKEKTMLPNARKEKEKVV